MRRYAETDRLMAPVVYDAPTVKSCGAHGRYLVALPPVVTSRCLYAFAVSTMRGPLKAAPIALAMPVVLMNTRSQWR